MPCTLYLSSREEFTVTAEYDMVVEQWSRGGRVELTAIWWTDSEDLDPLREWPAYRETKVTVDFASVVAIEREDDWIVGQIKKAKAFHAEHG